ncbi:MAG: hypothetical protein AB1492_02605 [Bacillota bacterium]
MAARLAEDIARQILRRALAVPRALPLFPGEAPPDASLTELVALACRWYPGARWLRDPVQRRRWIQLVFLTMRHSAQAQRQVVVPATLEALRHGAAAWRKGERPAGKRLRAAAKDVLLDFARCLGGLAPVPWAGRPGTYWARAQCRHDNVNRLARVAARQLPGAQLHLLTPVGTLIARDHVVRRAVGREEATPPLQTQDVLESLTRAQAAAQRRKGGAGATA